MKGIESKKRFSGLQSNMNGSLFTLVKDYIASGTQIRIILNEIPSYWPKYQAFFNRRVSEIYKKIYSFEENHEQESRLEVNRLKKIFSTRYRQYFLHGEYISWSYEKPLGYAGDYKIIDDIYRNNPSTTGFDRLWDNYFQQLAAPYAIRERKDDCKKIIRDFVSKNIHRPLRIMNLASGPAREIKELFEEDTDGLLRRVTFDCIDFDQRALQYAQKILMNGAHKVNFLQKNALRLALIEDIAKLIPSKYDVVYSLGLFDYLNDGVATKLIANLRNVLNKDGLLFVSNVRDRSDNPSASWMEWVADWYLVYRPEEAFRKIFIDAGFSPKSIELIHQKSKVMQYCFART